MKIKALIDELKKLADPKRAKTSSRFFKTGEGQYGYGDIFLGITVPVQRNISHAFVSLPLNDVEKLLKSPIHEYRFVGLEILVAKYEKGDQKIKKEIVHSYLKNKKCVNNWDLVDTSAEYILGDCFFGRSKKILLKMARSKNLWERRMAIVATFHFIKKNKFNETLKIANILLGDQHDLIHKATGWMLREVGKRSPKTEIMFLNKHYRSMPRTMLRYAIEKFSPQKRKYYLRSKNEIKKRYRRGKN
ncbi:MAG: DNA alkylation repair protein [Candidatus Staskawiczbacteria bacterium RIFCSPHIGHO2_02_FULL_42_22]|uniref:DNA alkylation repair protein n=1 Tax=Candidatus Staskawiczbacteria bacterium RIFCSPHIGHO2_02_FULL_42_22 TaxID=1802207 RepID=A0A1G2I202_9BACT|nr:MAG: DNA alkylation repair protein [Candidatus Staskawiczbacteria bacterium RIFCSPHIGHO2_02_FULL_42_22]